MQLYDLFKQRVAQYGDNKALEWDGGVLTYSQMARQANCVGYFLQEKLPQEGQNISLLIPNTPHFFFALFGILGAGHTAVPYNPLLTPEEISMFVNHSDSKILLYDPVMQEKALKVAEHTGIEAIDVSTIVASGSQEPLAFLNPASRSEDPCLILYTSGTTGDPKGVVLSHGNIFANLRGFNAVLLLEANQTFVCTLPLFHVFAMTIVLFGAMNVGARVLLFPQFNPQKLLETFVTDPNVLFVAVPPMYMMLARLAPDGIAKTHTIKYAVSGGGPLPVDVNRMFKAKFNIEILEGYGLTETSPVVAVNDNETNRIGTIGRHIPGIEVSIRDMDGVPVKTGEVGELCVRGPIVMQGYYKNKTMTDEVFYEGGWFRTGDLSTVDEEGYYKIVGRCKDLIVCGGENIYPREIEEHLMRFPGVMEVAVVGKPDKLRQEIPHAFVVLAEEVKDKITESALRKHCREFLAEYKIPHGFSIVDSMPKTATNKIQKEKLKPLLR
jgi:long-chain acyl-CoA synthetase